MQKTQLQLIEAVQRNEPHELNDARCNEDAANSAPAAIEAIGLTKRYGDMVAVNNISITVERGRIFGFLGPNGAGKSTTIGCLTGLLDPTEGHVRLLGEEFTSRSYHLKQRIGVMPEGLALFDQLYAHEFLMFQARMFGLAVPVAQQRVTELLQALELKETKKRLAAFSTGMRKKVAFAAAIIHRPDIVFLDEPFESIDPGGVATLKGWLSQLAKQGRTVFLTSHALDTVERFCDEVAIMVEGKLVWRGPTLSASQPGSRFQAGDEDFATLEELFLHITGQSGAPLAWI